MIVAMLISRTEMYSACKVGNLLALLQIITFSAMGNADDRQSIVLCVHGVSSSGVSRQSEYAYSVFHHWAEKALGQAKVVDFDWAGNHQDTPLHASIRVGLRTDQIEGQSDLAWAGTAKLKDVVAQLRHKLWDIGKISIVARSQGTVVTLAALQEGMQVDNVIFMGSPLSETLIEHGRDGCEFNLAAKNVRWVFLNLASAQDSVVDDLVHLRNLATPGGCIGGRGLPSKIRDLGIFTERQRYRFLDRPNRGVIASVMLEDVDHSGDRGWWNLWWLQKPAPNTWPSEIQPTDFIQALASNCPITTDISSIVQLASGDEFSFATQNGFGSGANRDEASWTFSISKGMITGFHFDDKDQMNFTLEVLEGDVNRELLHATWSEWEPEFGLPSRRTRIADGTVAEHFRSKNKLLDATFWLRLTTDSDFCRVRCHAIANDD